MSAREGEKTLEERIARQNRENAPRPRPSESSRAQQKPEDHERPSALELERSDDELRRPSRLVFDPGGRSPPLRLRCSRGPQLSTHAIKSRKSEKGLQSRPSAVARCVRRRSVRPPVARCARRSFAQPRPHPRDNVPSSEHYADRREHSEDKVTRPRAVAQALGQERDHQGRRRHQERACCSSSSKTLQSLARSHGISKLGTAAVARCARPSPSPRPLAVAPPVAVTPPARRSACSPLGALAARCARSSSDRRPAPPAPPSPILARATMPFPCSRRSSDHRPAPSAPPSPRHATWLSRRRKRRGHKAWRAQ